jgi:hypothetical protein
MNKKQKIVCLIGVGVIILMTLIPPWYYHVASRRVGDRQIVFEHQGNYGFLFSPPDPPDFGYRNYCIARIDLSRLLVQWVVVAIATGGIVWFLKRG